MGNEVTGSSSSDSIYSRKDVVTSLEQAQPTKHVEKVGKHQKDTLDVADGTEKAQKKGKEIGEPELEPSNEQLLKQLQQAKANLGSSPWLADSNSAAIVQAMLLLMDVLRKSRFVEGQANANLRVVIKELSEKLAENIKNIRVSEANSKMLEGIASFTNAALSFVEFSTQAKNRGAATKEVEAEIEAQNQVVQQKKGAAVGDANTPPEELAARRTAESEAEARLKKMEDKKSKRIDTKTQLANTQSHAFIETLQGLVRGTSQVMEAGLTVKKGDLEAEKQRKESLLQVYNTLFQNEQKWKDEAGTGIRDVFEAIRDFLSSSVRAHQMKG